ncbi:MAG: porin family protein [Bacteroidales bacterium]|nr:porin family protein [Bacteroidales bacterium]MDD3891274.1 porin family protein [Bacteroidales bacterium]
MYKPLLFLLLAFSPLLAVSQNFTGGVLGGMAMTQVDGDGLGGYDRAGVIAGVWVSRSFSRTISVRTELKFIQKGSYRRFTDGAGGTTGEYNLRLNYLEMPFLLEYHFWDNIIPFAGISAGYLWKSIEKNDGYENPIDDNTRFKKAELAAHAGVEYMLNSSFSLCATFSYSVLPVRRHTGDVYYLWNLSFGQYNNVIQLYLRYHF